MGLQRDTVCTLCGLVACAHLAFLGAVEAAHPRTPERQPAVTVELEAVPPEPDHNHRESVATAYIEDNPREQFLSGLSSLPPGTNTTLDVVANEIARQAHARGLQTVSIGGQVYFVYRIE